MLRRVAGKDGRFKISNSARDLQVNAVLKSLTVRNGTARRIKIPVDICIRESFLSMLQPSSRSFSPSPIRRYESYLSKRIILRGRSIGTADTSYRSSIIFQVASFSSFPFKLSSETVSPIITLLRLSVFVHRV